ncbi:hypothetical protein [Litchfieldia alkalitelluris]|uniref:hypothetical protein n=1 Tax=Litchfieldia alkalitelluris TaxID=304268 RepID=UPI001473B687|nr:hypothetical protein [Litchfieldia alkalitelluris]
MAKKNLSVNEEFGHEMGDYNSAKIIDLLVKTPDNKDNKVNTEDNKKKHRT